MESLPDDIIEKIWKTYYTIYVIPTIPTWKPLFGCLNDTRVSNNTIIPIKNNI